MRSRISKIVRTLGLRIGKGISWGAYGFLTLNALGFFSTAESVAEAIEDDPMVADVRGEIAAGGGGSAASGQETPSSSRGKVVA